MKDISNRQSERRSWRTTALTTAVLMALSMTSVSVNSAANGKQIGDLEIYEAAEGGKITITMMLDTSGSMSALVPAVKADACDLPVGVSSNNIKTETSSTTPYDRVYCLVTINGQQEKYYDRLTRLKDALFTLMDSAQLDPKRVAIGIGQFSSQSESNNNYTSADGTSGKIMVPAALVSPAQRTAIKNAVAALKGDNGTPTANAYAEAGAYMMGTNTSVSITNPREEYVKSGSRYYKCTSWSGTGCIDTNNSNISSSNGYIVADCQRYINSTCLSKSKTQSSADWGFSGFEKSFRDVKSGANYVSPLTSSSSCDGRGIYFLTDGEPNSSPTPLPLMKSALGSKGTAFNPATLGTLPNGSNYGNGMPEVGAFAKAIRDPALNPLGKNNPILTAVVGFGSDFNVDRAEDATRPEADRVIRTLSYLNASGEEETGEFYNCNKIANIDAKNACNWGAKSHPKLTGVGKFGEGGFYSAQSTDDIVNSIVNFVADLNQTLPSAPSGTITVPNDPYQASNQLAYAYLPMLAPAVSSNDSIWKGNLKKYSLNQGTLFGKKDSKLYSNIAGDLSDSTQDLWQTSTTTSGNSAVDVGGVYAQLRTPKSGRSSVRKVYVEDYETLASKKPILRELSVDNAGKPIGFNLLVDTTTYTQQNQLRLLNFLGFDEAVSQSGQQIDLVLTSAITSPNLIVSNLTLVQPIKEIKVLGGVVHSKPTAISYSATLDENGRVTSDLSKRDDYVLFGSMDGALHLADSDDGKETVAIIPRSMMINQTEALVSNSTKANVGQPYFGVDAPWLVTTDYKYDLPTGSTSGGVTVDDSTGNGMFAYGGLRMGGEAFYGIDITKSTAPKALFTITSEGLNGTVSNDFARLGQIWNKPTVARIRLTRDADPIDVLIFGGGYDMQYESEDYVASSTTPAKGNAIYIINAQTGELIWSASKDSNAGSTVTSRTNENMLHSITGEITILDRDNDGLMDHFYAADLGGQVFRGDFQNARPEKFGFKAVNTATVKRVTRILDTTPSGTTDKKFSYRFYERPVVSFYRSEGGTNNGKIFALVNVISGNRSSPLSTLRSNNDNANRVYGIIDTDVGRRDLFTAADASLGVANVKESSLVNLAATLGNTPTENIKKDTQTLLMGTASIAAKNGWYYPLTRFDGYNNVRYNKGIGDSVVINNLLYTTVYNPDKQYGTVDSCAARIAGGSERQVYCLPYGICMDSASVTGTGGFTPAGQGIQELTLGAFNKDNTNLKVLIGTTTITDRILADNRNNYNAGGKVNNGTGIKVDSNIKGTSGVKVTGGDGSAVEYIFNERYTLQPRAWYERQQ